MFSTSRKIHRRRIKGQEKHICAKRLSTVPFNYERSDPPPSSSKNRSRFPYAEKKKRKSHFPLTPENWRGRVINIREFWKKKKNHKRWYFENCRLDAQLGYIFELPSWFCCTDFAVGGRRKHGKSSKHDWEWPFCGTLAHWASWTFRKLNGRKHEWNR